MPIEEYHVPTALPEALACMRGGDVTVLAGGTDVMPQTQAGRVAFGRALLNLQHVDALRGIGRANGHLRIGTLTTITALLADADVQERFPLLAQACDHFASDQIRNAATLGGNVCNASPAGDTLVPLLVYDAVAELARLGDGGVTTRRVPLTQFFLAPGRTVRARDELLCALHLPLPAAGFVGRFVKFGTRPALDISTVAIAIGGVRRNGALTAPRVAYGAVAPVPMRAPLAEAALDGTPLDDAAIERVAAVARDEVRPIDDVRASAWYRRELVFNLTRRMLADVAHA